MLNQELTHYDLRVIVYFNKVFTRYFQIILHIDGVKCDFLILMPI
jgi:hypothetical protein